ncbi:Beta-galactosidase [hydrothermal vent metagenome]|uniref:Beta-galactosidase n=1 Tax=hydrothermal vent metagenome TaxID=652676 RepID=A0A3B1E4W6_9ZZZZ
MKKYRFKTLLLTLLIGVFGIVKFIPICNGAEVTVQKNKQGNWELLVDKEPYFIKGISYTVSKVGESPEAGYAWNDWAFSDVNKNGKIDGPYDSWVDVNDNNRQDASEPIVGDFQLMKEMGVNTLRWYHNSYREQKANKELLRDLYSSYGIRTAVGDFLGAYTIGSGALWQEGTDYRNIDQQNRMLESVKKMVIEHKDEPYLLFWILGNENNLHFTQTNAGKYPEAYAKFLNKAADLIHQLDGQHPVALVNGDDKLVKYYGKFAKNIDIFGTNAYRGADGFGDLWENVKKNYDKPVLITEYGFNKGIYEEKALKYHRGCWLDIVKNKSNITGSGNSIGGMVFEWLDRWWTAGDPKHHAPIDISTEMGPYSWDQEYIGITTQGDGSQSPFLRKFRKTYFLYKNELWSNL